MMTTIVFNRSTSSHSRSVFKSGFSIVHHNFVGRYYATSAGSILSTVSTTDDGLYGDSSVLGVLFIILFGKKPVGRSVLERSRHSSEPTTTPISMLLSKMGPSQFCWKILCNKCGINSIYRPPMMACLAIRQFWESRYFVGVDAAFPTMRHRL